MLRSQNVKGKSNIECYNAVDELREWFDSVYNEIIANLKSNRQQVRPFLKKDFLQILYYFILEITNFPESQQDAFKRVISYMQSQSGITNIEELFERCKGRVKCSQYVSEYSRMFRSVEGDMVLYNVGRLGLKIPLNVLNKLGEKLGENYYPEIIDKLIIRYFPLGIDTGYFWSIDRKLYSFFESTSTVPSLECFASPFNHFLDNYCSIYEDDTVFGSKGNFFDYIRHLTTNKIPMRLIINPPYIEKIVEEAAAAVTTYLSEVPGADAILVYSTHADKSRITINSLKNFPIYSHVDIPHGKSIIHDYSKDMDINPRVGLTFTFLRSKTSPNLAVDIQEFRGIVNQSYNDFIRKKISISDDCWQVSRKKSKKSKIYLEDELFDMEYRHLNPSLYSTISRERIYA